MEPFKNVFHPLVIRVMADVFKKHFPRFPHENFLAYALENLDNYELKERSRRIEEALDHFLPKDFEQACECIVASLHPNCNGAPYRAETSHQGIQGWMIMPLTEYVGKNGYKNFTLAMAVMRELTMRFSSEFGIRHLIIHDPMQALAIMKTWCSDENEHVRRLVSEGSRSRLPWGLRIQHFIKNPKLTIPLLEKLLDDDSEYVRRSVANHLNDVAKDHPDYAYELAKKWLKKKNVKREKLIRHGLRGLLKSGHGGALSLMSLADVELSKSALRIAEPMVRVGECLDFTFTFQIKGMQQQKIRMDYVIHYQTAAGRLSPKVYRWSESVLEGAIIHARIRKHNMRPITTRKFYPGEHLLEIRLNGKSVARGEFTLA